MTYHMFTDLNNQRECALIITAGQPPVVAHPVCAARADVSLDLDAFYCASCHYSGRVSGAWVHDMMRAERDKAGNGD